MNATKKPGVNPGPNERYAGPVFHKLPAMLLIVKYGKILVSDRVKDKKKSSLKREKIHCRLRNVYFVMVNQFMMTTVEFL